MAESSIAGLPMTPAYARVMLRMLGANEPAIEAAFVRGGPARQDEITVGEQVELIRTATRRLKPGWGLRRGPGPGLAIHGALGFAFVTAPDLRTSLSVLERFGPGWMPLFRSRRARQERGIYSLSLDEALPMHASVRIALLEMTSVARKEMVEAVLGEPIEGATFDFDYPAPAYASAYEEKLGTTVRFERPGTAMRLPAAWLRRRSAMADASMFRISLERLEERTRQLARREFVVAHVEELLASAGDAGMSIEEAARALGMSRRSLTRRLAEHGTSFREVRDDHLRSRAERLLRDPDLHLADVAFRLGYRDVANFGRASRRWFGMPPGRFRRSLAEG